MTSEQITAWTSLGTMLGMIAVGVMNQISDRRRKVEAEEAKKKAEEALAVNKATHLLVNSAMLEQLFIGMVAAESLNAAQPNKVNQDLASEARRSLGSVEPPSPKRRSKIARGFGSIGRGTVSFFHDTVFV